MLAAVAAEVGLGRFLVRGLEKKPVFIRGVPQKIVPPTWFVALDYLALFLLYFVALLGVIVLAARARELALSSGRGSTFERVAPRDRRRHRGGAGGGGGLRRGGASRRVETLLHVALLGVAVHQLTRVWTSRGDVGAAIGLTLCAAPILLYAGASLFSGELWTEDQMMGGDAKAGLGKLARSALAMAAIASPYCLAPRPFARSMTRVLPFAIALVVAGVGAAALRYDYVTTVKAVNNVLGLDLRIDAPQDQIALYLLAFATITWTVAACATASSPSRRRIGFGLAMLVLAGYGFAWPAAFVTAGVGLVLMGDGAVRVRDEERAAFIPVTPAIDDDAWQGYVGQTVTALRRPDRRRQRRQRGVGARRRRAHLDGGGDRAPRRGGAAPHRAHGPRGGGDRRGVRPRGRPRPHRDLEPGGAQRRPRRQSPRAAVGGPGGARRRRAVRRALPLPRRSRRLAPHPRRRAARPRRRQPRRLGGVLGRPVVAPPRVPRAGRADGSPDPAVAAGDGPAVGARERGATGHGARAVRRDRGARVDHARTSRWRSPPSCREARDRDPR